jgi:hypothetical protein
MKKILLIVVFAWFGKTSLMAQSVNSIIGKWNFSHFADTLQLDSLSKSFLVKMFGSCTFYFKENYHYNIFFIKKEEGEWQYNADTKILNLLANRGTGISYKIIIINDSTLEFTFGEDKKVVLQRDVDNFNDIVEEDIVPMSLMKASKNQICKKWYFCKMDTPNLTCDLAKILANMPGGSSYEFNQDNSYNRKAGDIETNGNWELGKLNNSIQVSLDQGLLWWRIKSISETELVLIKGNTTELWTFCAKKK